MNENSSESFDTERHELDIEHATLEVQVLEARRRVLDAKLRLVDIKTRSYPTLVVVALVTSISVVVMVLVARWTNVVS